MMIIDLRHCKIIHEMDQDLDIIPDNASDIVIPHLTREIWVVILVVEGSKAKRDELANTHFQSKLLKRVKLHSEDDTFIVSLTYLSGPCFVVYNKDYCTT